MMVIDVVVADACDWCAMCVVGVIGDYDADAVVDGDGADVMSGVVAVIGIVDVVVEIVVWWMIVVVVDDAGDVAVVLIAGVVACVVVGVDAAVVVCDAWCLLRGCCVCDGCW